VTAPWPATPAANAAKTPKIEDTILFLFFLLRMSGLYYLWQSLTSCKSWKAFQNEMEVRLSTSCEDERSQAQLSEFGSEQEGVDTLFNNDEAPIIFLFVSFRNPARHIRYPPTVASD
jgi:hypothetical protein